MRPPSTRSLPPPTPSATPPLQSTKEAAKNQAVPLLRAPGLALVLDTPKGRGVFAKCDIPAHEVVDVSPVLVLSPEENAQHVCRTELYHYTYNWPLPTPSSPPNPSQAQKTTTQAIVLGLGSLFNHSTRSQNVGWTRSIATQTITYTTLRPILAGEELCMSSGSRLTFTDVDADKGRGEDSGDEGELVGGLGRIELD